MHARFLIIGIVERSKPLGSGVELTITTRQEIPHPERPSFRVLVLHPPFAGTALARADRHWSVEVEGSIVPRSVNGRGKRIQVVDLVVESADVFAPL